MGGITQSVWMPSTTCQRVLSILRLMHSLEAITRDTVSTQTVIEVEDFTDASPKVISHVALHRASALI